MNIFLTLGIVLLFHIIFWYLVSVVIKRMDVADFAWGLGFPLLSWGAFVISGFSVRSIVVNLLITIWGARLASHIYSKLRTHSEDARYVEMRKSWKNFQLRSFMQVFFLQGILLYLIAIPSIFINSQVAKGLDLFAILGVLVWLIGFYFESVGDKQLAEFIKKPENAGKIMDQGLWRYSRHPNYFGEVTMWWGIFLCGLGLSGGLLTVVGPITITCLILFVSGVPLLEKRYLGNVAYEEYKKRTSVFIPLPPKKI